MKRYRPVLNNRKEVIMSEDESGDWTSLSCYYTLHDRVARAEGKVAAIAAEYVELKDLYLKCRIDIGNLHKENERLRARVAELLQQVSAVRNLTDSERQEIAAAKEGRDAK